MNNHQIEVTIAIPFYNDEKYLFDSIQSVLNQTYKNWELILIDDGSKDSSLEIAKKFQSNNIKVVSDGKNKGLAVRLNESTKLACGKYYARMDADDIMDVDRVEKQVFYLETHPDIDVVGSDVYVIDKDNSIIGKTQTAIMDPCQVEHILKGGMFVHPSVMGKRQWFLNHPYDEKLIRMQDKGLWLRTVNSSKFHIMPDKFLFYRAGGLPTMKKNLKELSCLKTLFFTILGREQNRYGLAIRLYTIGILKLLVYAILELFGKVDVLVQRRYEKLDISELKNAGIRLNQSISLSK